MGANRITGSDARRPRIAINPDVQLGSVAGVSGEGGPFRRERAALYTDYVDAIYEAGGEPVILPPDLRALATLDAIDGVLLTGGDDYIASIPDPESPPPRFEAMAPRREEFDRALAHDVLARDLPLLAICAGLQLLVIEGGGRILGDIEHELRGALAHRRESVDAPHPEHAVEWFLPHPPGVDTVPRSVMSHHHQGVAEVPAGWRIWGRTEDGVIEGAIGPGTWQVAVQWHPELSPRTAFGRAIFEAFVTACAEGRPSLNATEGRTA